MMLCGIVKSRFYQCLYGCVSMENFIYNSSQICHRYVRYETTDSSLIGFKVGTSSCKKLSPSVALSTPMLEILYISLLSECHNRAET